MKKKILAWCDYNAPTGFGNVSKNLLSELNIDYELQVIGINYYGNKKYDTTKAFVYPVSRDDIFGFRRLFEVADAEKPDLIFLFQDIFHISDLINDVKMKNPQAKIIVYFPIDGSPYSIHWGNVLEYADAIITYSDWAIQVIKDRFPNVQKPIHKIYHGVDTSTFFPFPEKEIIKQRKLVGWGGKFVIGAINRYQPRKAIPLSIRAYSMFAKGYKVCKCGNIMPIHNIRCDLNMCDPKDIIEEIKYDKKDIYYYAHMMAQEPSMGPGKTNMLQHHFINAGFNDIDYGTIIGINSKNIYAGEVPESDINKIYNSINVNISTAIGEGAGLSLLESAATGTISIAPRNSAIPEQLRDTGVLVNNKMTYIHPMDNGHIRPTVDPFLLMQAIEKEYNKWKESGKEKIIDEGCINNIKTNFQWQDKRDQLAKIIKDTFNQK